MTLGSLIAVFAVLGGLAAILWHWDARRWILALAIPAGVAIAQASGGLRPYLFRTPAGAVYLGASVVLGGVLMAEGLGLPGWAARRIGLGVRTPHYRFRRALWEHQRAVNSALAVVSDQPITREVLSAAIAAADPHVRAMTALASPNADWQRIRDEVVAHDVALIDWYAAGCPPDAVPDQAKLAQTMRSWRLLDRTTDAPMLGAGLGRVGLAIRQVTPRLLFGFSLALVGLSDLGAFPGAVQRSSPLELVIPAGLAVLGAGVCLSVVLPLERWISRASLGPRSARGTTGDADGPPPAA